MSRNRTLLALSLALLLAGCGSILSRPNSGWGKPFGGVRLDITAPFFPFEEQSYMSPAASVAWILGITPLAAIDLPLSFLADLLSLPWTLQKTSAPPALPSPDTAAPVVSSTK